MLPSLGQNDIAVADVYINQITDLYAGFIEYAARERYGAAFLNPLLSIFLSSTNILANKGRLPSSIR